MDLLGMASPAGHNHRITGNVSKQRFGQLRAGAVTGAKKKDPGRVAFSRLEIRLGRTKRQTRMKRAAGFRQQLPATAQVEAVVGISSIGRASPHRDQPVGPETSEMV
jgi:hypothetical protein